jgi:uncharacterized membrane protein
MTRFGKLLPFFMLLGCAALVAAMFGALHNQLSYSVGPSYFTALKFPQFGIAEATAPRWGAAIVGVQASWWMGVMVALPALLIGLVIVPRVQSYVAAGLGAIGLVVVFSLFMALIGLVGGLAADRTGLLDTYLNFPDGPTRSDFLRAGFMHDASYLGGALGALLALWPMFRARSIDRMRAAQ